MWCSYSFGAFRSTCIEHNDMEKCWWNFFLHCIYCINIVYLFSVQTFCWMITLNFTFHWNFQQIRKSFEFFCGIDCFAGILLDDWKFLLRRYKTDYLIWNAFDTFPKGDEVFLSLDCRRGYFIITSTGLWNGRSSSKSFVLFASLWEEACAFFLNAYHSFPYFGLMEWNIYVENNLIRLH